MLPDVIACNVPQATRPGAAASQLPDVDGTVAVTSMMIEFGTAEVRVLLSRSFFTESEARPLG